MTKITTYNRGIIIDGHADTKEECETITLLCDSLAKDKNFKQVAYDKGYAAFERVGHTEELKFGLPVEGDITVNFDAGIQSVDFKHGSATNTFTTSGESYNFFTEPGNDIILTANLKSGYSLKSSSLGSVSGNTITIPINKIGANMVCTLVSEAATVKKSVDLTTLSGWSNLAPGTHTIKIVAKGTGYRDSEKSAGVTVSKAASMVTLEKGTYKFADNPTSPDVDLQETIINTKSYYLTDNNVYATEAKDVYQIDVQTTDTGRASLTIFIDVTAGATTYNLFDGETETPSWHTNDFSATDTTKLKMLLVEQNIEVSPAFYKWAITDGNLVKQTGYKLTLQLMAFQQDQDPSNAYIKINSDTVSSTDYDYMIQGSPSSIFDKNGVRVDASSALVITGVYKVAWRGAYSAYLIGGDTPQIVGSQYTLSTYELSGDTTLQIRYEYSGSLSSPANTEEPTI